MYITFNSTQKVMPPSDFSMLKNFNSKTYSWKSHAEHDAKQLSGSLLKKFDV